MSEVMQNYIKTYDEWVRYFLDHGALIDLAELLAASKLQEQMQEVQE